MAIDKTFDAAAEEDRIYQKWEEAGAFKAGAGAKPGALPYSVMIPPPNVTGSLHMGHAFNNTLQDILVRWHRMRGFDTLWQPGQDHAGIATQMVVERELHKEGKSRRDFSREAFTAKIWEWKARSGGTIVNQLKRLGSSCDWSRNAFTMSGAPNAPEGEGGNFHDAVIKVFVEMYNKGLIYRGKRLVNWDPHFETAISDLEVENVETDGHMWHFKYPLAGGATYEYIERDAEGAITLRETRDYISIATTRPETMLGDGAVAVHPDDARYAPIVGQLCEIPVGPKEHRRLIPIITDEYPDPDFGSGAVKITGAHDFNDYQVAKRGGIPMYRLMDTRGGMRADGAPYADEAAKAQALGQDFTAQEVDAINLVPDAYRGMDRFEARKKVVADIDAEGLMIKVEDKMIMQPFGDRSKVVIEPMLTDQWFVDTAQIVGPALEAVRKGDVKIIPESGEKTYYHWLENIEPWCISRQLWWGHQIPVWFDEAGTQYCATSEAGAQAMAGEGVALRRDPDVLDTWFSSGLWPIGTLGWPEGTDELARYFPTSDLVTGQDILFFWVARMMMMQLAVVGEIPFKNVYLHGLVRDAQGKKMSKSLGNVIDPLELIDEFGADALRFANAAMASLGGALKLDTARITGYRNFGTKLWNAARFAEMNVAQPDPSFDPGAVQATLNKWIIGEVARTRVAVDQALASYRFNDAALTLYAFTWGKLCDWYVEFSKPLLQGDDAAVAEETRRTLAWVIDQALILLHPIMPFITEKLWEAIAPREGLLMLAPWPEYDETLIDAAADHEMNWVIGLIEAVRSLRAEMRVPAGAKIPMLQLDLDEAGKAALAGNAALVLRLARITEITPAAEAPRDAVSISVEGGSFALPLGGIIDIAAEAARLSAALTKLEKELKGIEAKLGNVRFTENAPEEVVDAQRTRLEQAREEAARLEAAYHRVQALSG